jgi:Ca2+-binding EF-hand superfamily protein
VRYIVAEFLGLSHRLSLEMHNTHTAPHTITLLLFRSSDTDGDGIISDNELRTMVSALNLGQVANASNIYAVFDIL